jgi:uncharacterized alkaline shock family protein YloU
MTSSTEHDPALAFSPARASIGQAGSPWPADALGRTIIADTVVAKIAGVAAREIGGVHSLGGGASRMVGALRERIPGGRINHSQGVDVEVGEKQAAIDIGIVADYGVAIHELAAGIRRNVILAVERMTGLDVTEVNVTVHDIYLGEDEMDSPEPPRPRVK